MRQQGVPRPGTPPTTKGRHAVSAATILATGRRAARSAAPQRGENLPSVTELDGGVSQPPPSQMPPAGGCMVLAPGAGVASIPAFTNAGGLDTTGASVLVVAGAQEAAAACCASANRRRYTPSSSAAVAAARSTGTVSTSTAPTAATKRGLNMPGAPLGVADQPAEAGNGDRCVAAGDGGAAAAVQQSVPLQAAPVAAAQRAVPRQTATSAGSTTTSVGEGARLAVWYASVLAARSQALKPRGNAAQRRRFRGAVEVAGRAKAAATATAAMQRSFAAQAVVAAAAAGTTASLQQRLSLKARMFRNSLLPDTCQCQTA